MNKSLILLRGLPGSGKTTLGYAMGVTPLAADDYFYDEEGNYNFDGSKLKIAHNWCKVRTEHQMEDGIGMIVVSNTFTQEWEMESYYKLAEQYGYTVFSLIVENRHDGINEHGVPADKLEQMKNRFEIKLN
jgi:predicted kinase